MSQPSAWWEDVEHLREAAERRIAERERAQREGREPIALPPLRPLSDGERATVADRGPSSAPRPLTPAPRLREGRFRRATAALGSPGPRRGAATGTRPAVPPASALARELAVEPEPMLDPWTVPAEVETPR